MIPVRKIACALPLAALLIITNTPRAQDGPGRKILRYGILDYGKSKRTASGPRKPAASVYISPRTAPGHSRELFFNTKRIYNAVRYATIVNSGKTPAKVRVRIKSPASIPMGINGTGGEEPVSIPAGSHVSLPVKIFAQDAVPGLHAFFLELLDASGKLLEERAGKLYIAGPEVKLILRPLPASGADGLRRTFELKNLGDELTDLSLELEDLPGYAMNPRVDHYLLGPGKRVTLEIFPTGTSAGSRTGQVMVRAAGQILRFPISMRPAEGKLVQTISLDPIVRLRRKDWYCTNRPIIHLIFNVPYLRRVPVPNPNFEPRLRELKQKGRAFDTDGDDRLDHWQWIRKGKVIAKGDDYDGDGSIDFYRMSDAPGRPLNRGYFRKNKRWFETNLVDAFMVSSFVPMTDAVKVKPHDVDVLLNGKLILRRKKIVPTGSRLVRLRVDELAPNRKGFSSNKVTVSTSHLPDSHYQVTAQNTLLLHFSSIQIPLLTQKPVKLDTTAIDKAIRQAEAKLAATSVPAEQQLYRAALKKNRAYRDEILKQASAVVRKAVTLRGVQHEGLDLGIYSSELQLSRGTLRGYVRNQAYEGAAYRLTLHRLLPNGRKEEIAVRRFPYLPPFGRAPFALRVPGHNPRRRHFYRLELKALPRKARPELALSNNVAHLVTGPPPSVDGLRKEMRYLAQELGTNQDQLTLVRKAPIFRVNRGLRPYVPEPTILDVTLSTPTGFTDAVKTPRTFFFDER